MAISRDTAEIIALEALAWIVGQDDLAPVFLGASGASQDELKIRSADPEFLAAVLDFLVMDDAWVVGFCDAQKRAYTEPMAARAMLPGGEAVHWT
ncbi:MAG: DUF3572 domain-containing protein [Marinovum sp.]|nr:DUF3572 domain-containing protein [Marinovum sp.]